VKFQGQFGKGHAAVWTQKEWTGVAADLVKPTNSLERKKVPVVTEIL
jgi:hypothetical protein